MSVFAVIFPLLFLVGLGYGLTRSKKFNQEQITGISRFAFNISIPAFLFINMARADLSQSIHFATMLTFYVPVLLVYCFGYFIGRWQSQPHDISNQAPQRARNAVYALGCSYSNTVLVGLPIIVAALGERMMGVVFVIITFHSALLFALTFLLSASGRQQGGVWQTFGRSMLLNPVVLSIGLGLGVNALNIPIADELDKALSLLAAPAIACALFVLGANLSFYRVSSAWQGAVIASTMKLAILPAFVYGMGKWVTMIEPQMLAVVVLMSASPLGVNSYLIASKIQAHQKLLGSTVVLSTVLCVVSYAFWLSLFI
ncbi:AEC family transporter [Shewanella gelidii]|uniref:Transporter n=1 Tax=Shewanella gelidii TaxID=1642821 RepID=A0A917NAL4_9GAMM|nr:AEC family transporter [Shewanella gelidii]MCL1098254.1 AEC family transporter [Shewanella gelidii]GGI83818.1 transporter [Shewanella gelidii]